MDTPQAPEGYRRKGRGVGTDSPARRARPNREKEKRRKGKGKSDKYKAPELVEGKGCDYPDQSPIALVLRQYLILTEH